MDVKNQHQSSDKKQVDFHNQPKIYTYEECINLSNYFFYEKNYYQARFWLDNANDILEGKEVKICN